MMRREGGSFDPIDSRKCYRDKPIDGFRGGEEKAANTMANQVGDGAKVGMNRGGGSDPGAKGAAKNPNSPSTKTTSAGGKAAGDAAKKAGTDAASKSVGKAALGSVGRGLNATGELKDLKNIKDQDGAGAAAAAAGLKTAEAIASKTGVGTAISAGIRSAQAGLRKIGVNVKDQYIVYVILLIPLLALLPFIVFGLIIFFAWKHPVQVLKLSFTNMKTFVGAVQALVIEDGGASKMAYEVEVGGNTTIAAPGDAVKPEAGTYEYKLAQIDWEKAKYQTLPVDNRCDIKTKKVVSVLDGKERSVIESVQLKTNPGKDLGGIARANCINSTYPIWQTMMRSQFVRDGINKSLSVRYAYAEPQDAPTLKTSGEEFDTTLRDKTLTRIWNRDKSIEKPTESTQAEVDANDAEVLRKFDGTRSVQKYTDKKYNDKILQCANMYVPKGDIYYKKDIDKMNHDLVCGINPKDILLYTTSPSESLVNDPDPNIAIKPKRAALNVVCDMYDNLLAPENVSSPAVENYRNKVKDRINSAAVAAWQAMTYADTHQKRFIDIKELGGDFYKIAGMQEGQEYNYTLDYRKTGVALEPDAISRIVGYHNQQANAFPEIQQEKQFQDALNKIFNFIQIDLGPGIGTLCEASKDSGYYDTPTGNTPQAKATQQQLINNFYTNAYPFFKQAIAGIDYYSNPTQSKSISQIYKDLTYEDLRFRLIRIESNVATAGSEDGPQNFNRMNFGMKAYTNALTLSIGGKFLTQNEAIVRDESTRIARMYDDRSKGLAWRLFNLDNPSSLTSRLAVSAIDKPQNIPSNITGTLASIINPVRNAAGERGTLTALITGESRVASAASVYDSTNLKLDPAGIPEAFKSINPIDNARFIEALKKDPTTNAKFAEWDQCFKESIPSRFHLLNPYPDKANLYKNVCKPLFDATASRDVNDLGMRYSAYHFHNLQADALIYLSDPNKEDETLNASTSTLVGPVDSSNTGNTSTITGLISPPNLGPAESNGSYKLPKSTDGSYVYDGDNGTGFGKEWDMCGAKEIIDVIYTVSQKWRQTYPNGFLQIGEITSAGHQSHKTGIDVDLDGKVGAEWVADFEKGNYSREKTIELAKMFIDTGLVTHIFYNDQAVIAAANEYAASKQITFTMSSLENHNHHFHVRINPKYKLPPFEYCPSVGHGD